MREDIPTSLAWQKKLNREARMKRFMARLGWASLVVVVVALFAAIHIRW